MSIFSQKIALVTATKILAVQVITLLKINFEKIVTLTLATAAKN